MLNLRKRHTVKLSCIFVFMKAGEQDFFHGCFDQLNYFMYKQLVQLLCTSKPTGSQKLFNHGASMCHCV